MQTEKEYQRPLCEDRITFGKYKDLTLSRMLKDRKYCEWLVKQDWFRNQYEFLYNRVKECKPLSFFVGEEKEKNEEELLKRREERRRKHRERFIERISKEEMKRKEKEEKRKRKGKKIDFSSLPTLETLAGIVEESRNDFETLPESKASKSSGDVPEFELMIPEEISKFIEEYKYFNLTPLEELKIVLSEDEKKCYEYYLFITEKIKEKMEDEGSFDIKAPTSWLNRFEQQYGLPRDVFKEFLSSYELPNITSIIEEIKSKAGIVYNGAKSFLIAKEKSLAQERYWEKILKQKYGEDIGSQYKFQKCIFDFIRIRDNVLYECKLGIKDFNEEQHRKYLLTLNRSETGESFKIVYLIDRDCVIDVGGKKIVTTNGEKYRNHLESITENSSRFEQVISTFDVLETNKLEEWI